MGCRYSTSLGIPGTASKMDITVSTPQCIWSVYRSSLPVHYNIEWTFLWRAPCRLVCRSWHNGFNYVYLRLLHQDVGFMTGFIGRQGILTPPMHLISPLMYPGIRVWPNAGPLLRIGVRRLITVFYLHLSYYYLKRSIIKWL